MSMKSWEALSPEIQKQMAAAAKEAEAYSLKI